MQIHFPLLGCITRIWKSSRVSSIYYHKRGTEWNVYTYSLHMIFVENSSKQISRWELHLNCILNSDSIKVKSITSIWYFPQNTITNTGRCCVACAVKQTSPPKFYTSAHQKSPVQKNHFTMDKNIKVYIVWGKQGEHLKCIQSQSLKI